MSRISKRCAPSFLRFACSRSDEAAAGLAVTKKPLTRAPVDLCDPLDSPAVQGRPTFPTAMAAEQTAAPRQPLLDGWSLRYAGGFAMYDLQLPAGLIGPLTTLQLPHAFGGPSMYCWQLEHIFPGVTDMST
jgi:hypothetical protein